MERAPGEPRLHFDSVVEGLWKRSLAGRLDASLLAALKKEGLDLSRPLDPAFPAEKMHVWVKLTARTLYPDVSEEVALRQLGAELFKGLTRTFVGKAMVAVMRVVGTRRSLERMQRNFRSGNNYINAHFRSLGKGLVELTLTDVNGLPAYYQGIVEEGGRTTGAADMDSTYTLDGKGGCTYRITWTEK
jgi:uncharacterized protein (TIGR02265 family)